MTGKISSVGEALSMIFVAIFTMSVINSVGYEKMYNYANICDVRIADSSKETLYPFLFEIIIIYLFICCCFFTLISYCVIIKNPTKWHC